MDDTLKRLESLLSLVDTKQNAEDMVKCLEMVVTYVKTFQDSTTNDLVTIFQKLNAITTQLKTDNQAERDTIKRVVGEAIASLRVELDSRIGSETSKIDSRLAEIRQPEDGKDADEETIITAVLAQIPRPKEVPPETPDETVQKINQSTLQIAQERIVGLVDALRQAANNAVSAVGITTTIFFKNGTQIGRAKNINIIEGSNTTVNMYQTGDQMNISISSTGGGGGGTTVSEEVPSGTIDGVNTTFTIAHTPQAGTLKVYLNGARQQLGTDYTLSTNTITFTYAPTSPSILFVDYVY